MPINQNISLKTAGLTLAETIIAIGVLAILISIAAPTLGQFYDKYRIRQEQAQQLEIYDALLLFSKTYNQLPSDDNTQNPMCGSGTQNWYDCISAFTNLNINAIQQDIWGNDRTYIATQETRNILGTTYQVTAASLHSKGINQVADTAINIAVNGDDFASATNSSWWANQSSPIARFETLRPGGDDIQIKITNGLQMQQKLKITQRRLQDIKKAITTLEDIIYTQEETVRPVTADSLIHLPPSQQDAQPNALARFSPSILNEITPYGFSGSRISNGNANNTQKRQRTTDMIKFMRILGLPDSHCCNALVKDPNANPLGIDYTQDEPFYYYVNPRVSFSSGACNPRAQTLPFVPAKVTVTPSSCG